MVCVISIFINAVFHCLFLFAGKNQVAVGLVPISFENKSSESALSVYPVAIANCKENRLEQI